MMIKSFMYIYFLIGLGVGYIVSSFFLKKREKCYINNYQSKYILYEKDLGILEQNFKNESILRNDIEKKLKHELQITYELHGQLSAAKENLKLLDYYKHKYEQVQHELYVQINLNNDQKVKNNELCIRFEEYKLLTEEKEKLLCDYENKLKIQFENLANQVLEKNRSKISEQNRLVLDQVLQPFREQLDVFKNQVQDNFYKEEQMRHALTYEVHNLHKLNTKITQETINLTHALKGNNKTQGNWGEVILTRALEVSGMREGHEFHLQINIPQIDGRKLQPDAIVHLPNGRNVVIDSKISLLAYERYFNSNNEKDRDLAIGEHIHSLRTHIKTLNKKDYQKLLGVNTLDYILMFVPIESALTIAIEKESSLLTDAMNCNIMLVSPTTLLIALRTINNLWSYEYQNYNAKKIAEKASRLYDKLRLFVEDLNKIGYCLSKAGVIYSSARNKFSEGRGNIISQAESFRTLGVQVKHPIVMNSISDCDLVVSKDDNKIN